MTLVRAYYDGMEDAEDISAETVKKYAGY